MLHKTINTYLASHILQNRYPIQIELTTTYKPHPQAARVRTMKTVLKLATQAERFQLVVPGCFARVSPGLLSRFPNWSFVARVEARHGAKEWKIDLGGDHDDYYAVPDSMLVKAQHDLNVIGVVDSYFRQSSRTLPYL